MGLQVTFDIFSGRPNPSVVLGDADAAKLFQRLQPAAGSGAQTVLPPFESTLGYRGLLIEQSGPSPNSAFPLRFRVVDGMLVAPNVAHRITDAAVEEFVLATPGAATGAMVPELVALIREQAMLRRSAPAARTAAAPPAPAVIKCPCAPLYEPAWWNDGGQRQLQNNCYNYACDYRTDTFAQPGNGGGRQISALTCPGVRPSALSDALLDYSQQSNQRPISCPDEGHLVALVIWPQWDFHWYRMGRNGFWSHKPGDTPVTNLDNSGLPISDPRAADRGHYTDFCCFMIAMHGHIKIS